MSEAGKPEWWFYHLKRTTLEQAAGPLLEKCLERGWRVLAVSPDVRRRGALDAALWTYDDQSFLPHGQAEAAGLDPSERPRWVIADDSGLCVDALDGAPGVYSARFAGENCTFADNNRKLLHNMIVFGGVRPAHGVRERAQIRLLGAPAQTMAKPSDALGS